MKNERSQGIFCAIGRRGRQEYSDNVDVSVLVYVTTNVSSPVNGRNFILVNDQHTIITGSHDIVQYPYSVGVPISTVVYGILTDWYVGNGRVQK
jgi:hypothetical protein